MLKRLSLVLIIIAFSSINFVHAQENVQSNQTINDKIINIWKNDAEPFLKGVACSFKTDVWDKANNWLEKNKFKKIDMSKNEEGKNEDKKNCTFFDTLHKAITGKEPTTK